MTVYTCIVNMCFGLGIAIVCVAKSVQLHAGTHHGAFITNAPRMWHSNYFDVT